MLRRIKQDFLFTIALLLALGSLTACGPTPLPSSDIATSSIYAEIRVTFPGNGQTLAQVVLSVGEPRGADLYMNGGDSLSAYLNNDMPERLAEYRTNYSSIYKITLDDDSGGTIVTITFERADATELVSTIELAAAPQLQPLGQTSYGSSGRIQLQWDAAPVGSPDISIVFDMTCRDSQNDQSTLSLTKGFYAPDSGSAAYTVGSDLLAGWDLSTLVNPTCTANITLGRLARQTQLAEGFIGGTLDVDARIATTTVTIIP